MTSAWDRHCDGEQDVDEAHMLAEAVRCRVEDPDLEMQRLLSYWAAESLAGDVRRGFLARVRSAADPSQRRWDPSDIQRTTTARQRRRRVVTRVRRRRNGTVLLAMTCAAVLIASIGVWGMLGPTAPNNDPTREPQVATLVSPKTGSAEEVLVVRILSLDGKVRGRSGGLLHQSDEVRAGEEWIVDAGSELRLAVGALDRLVLGHPNHETRITLQQVGADLHVHLAEGGLRASVQREGASPRWHVHIQEAVIDVVGTRFAVSVQPQQWSAVVNHGEVFVQTRTSAQSITAGTGLTSRDGQFYRVSIPMAVARPAVLISDRLHPDDAAAIVHALLSPDLSVMGILLTPDAGDMDTLSQWCQAMVEVLGRELVPVRRGPTEALTAENAEWSPAAALLARLAETEATPTEPLLVINLGASYTVLGDMMRKRPDLAARLHLIDLAFGDEPVHALGRDPRADAVVSASGPLRTTARLDGLRTMPAWPDSGPLARMFAQSGDAPSSRQADGICVQAAEIIARSQALPERYASADLIEAMTVRWQVRGPKPLAEK